MTQIGGMTVKKFIKKNYDELVGLLALILLIIGSGGVISIIGTLVFYTYCVLFYRLCIELEDNDRKRPKTIGIIFSVISIFGAIYCIGSIAKGIF